MPCKNSKPCFSCPHRIAGTDIRAKFKNAFGNRCHEHPSVYCYGANIDAFPSLKWKDKDTLGQKLLKCCKKTRMEIMEVFYRDRRSFGLPDGITDEGYPYTEIIPSYGNKS